MDTREVRRLLREGKTPRQVAGILGGSRMEVTRLAAQSRRGILKRALVACLTLSVAAGVSFAAYHQLKDPDDREVHARVLKAANALPRISSSDSSWFMERVPSGIESHVSLIEEQVRRLNRTLADNRDVPEVREEAALFSGRLVPTVFTRGVTIWVGKDPKPLKDAQGLEVVLYSRDSFNHPRIGRRLFFYDAGWNAFFMAALKFGDETWYGAIVAHELWHAKRHREGAASATAPVLSDPWVEEELEAHGVEGSVLDARTKGAYRHRLRAIVARRSAMSMKGFLATVEPSDIQELDRSFGQALPEEADLRTAQYYLDLGLLWLAGRYAGAELQEKRKQLYRYLISPQSTNVR